MAIISRGILGGFKGKVANVVGTSWKGRAVMKSLPLSVANPRSAGQVTQRSKFSNVTYLASQLLSSYVIPLWNPFAGDISGYNKFVSVNTPLASTSMTATIPSLSFSIGSLTPLVSGDVSATGSVNDTDVTVTWDGAPRGNQLSTDAIFCAIIDSATGELMGSNAGAVGLTGGSTVIVCKEELQSKQYLLLIAIRRADGSDASTTVKKLVAFS